MICFGIYVSKHNLIVLKKKMYDILMILFIFVEIIHEFG